MFKSLLNNKKLVNNVLIGWSGVGFYRGVNTYINSIDSNNKRIQEREDMFKNSSLPYEKIEREKALITIGALSGLTGGIIYYNIFLSPFTFCYELYNLECYLRNINKK